MSPVTPKRMRWLFAILLLPVLALAVPTDNVLIGRVVKVTDGDTITILTTDNEQERIRLYGIDAPESRGSQPYWKASMDLWKASHPHPEPIR